MKNKDSLNQCKDAVVIGAHMSEMRLWTIQPWVVWEQLQKNKIFRCDSSLARCMKELEFERAYRWMSEQMRRRIGEPPAGVIYPVWAWHTLDWQHKKPDLRRMEFRSYRGKHVCIEIKISADEVLLSDEVEWHYVLNDMYDPPVSNEDAFEEAWRIFDSFSREEQKELKEESWKQIFDTVPVDDGCRQTGRYIQATFWELNIDMVQSIRFFGG